MLNEALQVAARRLQAEQEKVAVAKLLDQLPIEVLREIAETGEIKLACFAGSDGSSQSWVEQFKGTPFFQQAIALEQESLQAEMARQQSSAVESQKIRQEIEQMDQIRLKKKLLELQKARNEAQVLDGGAGPPEMAGSPDPLGTAPGAPAGPPTEPAQKTAGVSKQAMDPKLMTSLKGAVGAGPKIKLKPGGNQFSARSFNAEAQSIPGSRDPFSSPKVAQIQAFDSMAREMARADAEKVAHAQEAFAVGDAAGRLMAKTALSAGQLASVAKWAPAALGLAGAAHGLLHEGGGIGDAISEGASGAALGGMIHAGAGMAPHLMKGHGVASSAKRYAAGLRRDVRNVTGSKAQILSPKSGATPKPQVPELDLPQPSPPQQQPLPGVS